MTSNAATQARRLLLLGSLACALPGFGCKKKGPESYVYSVFVEESVAIKAEGLELAGKPLVLSKQHPTGKSFQITLPASELLVEKLAAVVMTTSSSPRPRASPARRPFPCARRSAAAPPRHRQGRARRPGPERSPGSEPPSVLGLDA